VTVEEIEKDKEKARDEGKEEVGERQVPLSASLK